MAQVNGFNFQLNPQNLAALNGVRPDYMPDVWQWQQNAAQHDQTGLADLMRASQHEATMDPIRVQQGQATLADTQVGTEGKRLNNEAQRMKNEVEAYILPQAKLQAAKDLLLKGSEADEKLFAIEVDKMLRSDDPKKQAYGRQLLDTSRKALEEKRKAELDWSMKEKELRMQHSNAAGLQSARFAHEKDLRTMDTGKAIAVATIQAEARKAAKEAGGNPKKWQELAVALAVKLQAETDPDVKMEIAKELQFAQDMAERLAPQPQPTLDTSKLPPGTPLKDPRGPQPTPPSTGAKLGTPENPIKLN